MVTPPTASRLPVREYAEIARARSDAWMRAAARALEAVGAPLTEGDTRVRVVRHGPDNALPQTILPAAWFRHPGCRVRPSDTARALLLEQFLEGATCRSNPFRRHAAIGSLIRSHMAGYRDRPAAEEVAAALRARPRSSEQKRFLRDLFDDLDDKTDQPTELPSILLDEQLTREEMADALRDAGVTNGVVVNWINDGAVAPEPETAETEGEAA